MDYTFTLSEASQADYRNRRANDVNDEKIVGEYLDKYFYPTFSTTLERNTDKETQIQGLDITVTGFSGCAYTIDEKAATRWAGRNLQTFAHEVSSINVAGNLYDGWLLDFNSTSDYLVEVWIDGVNTADCKLHDYTNISDATIVLIKKSDLWSYLKKKGISSTALREISDNLRINNKSHEYYNGFKIIQQMNYQEHAVNILIPRDTLINTISSYAVRIKKGKTEILRKK